MSEEHEFDPQICEERHKSMSTRLGIMITLFGLTLTVAIVGTKFLIEAVQSAGKASEAVRDLALKADAIHKVDEINHNAMSREIEISKKEATTRLASAIEIIGYEQRQMRTEITHSMEKNSQQLELLSKDVTSLQKSVEDMGQ